MPTEIIFTHVNSERERLTIRRILDGEFAGHHILVIHDDPPPHGSGVAAPMLLDLGTQMALREFLEDFDG